MRMALVSDIQQKKVYKLAYSRRVYCLSSYVSVAAGQLSRKLTFRLKVGNEAQRTSAVGAKGVG
jgi:hypothetical protein